MTTARRFLKRLAVVFASLIILAILANAIAIWWLSGSVETQIAEIRAAGHPVSFHDLATQPGPLKEDARLLIDTIEVEIEDVEKKLEPIIVDESNSLLSSSKRQLVESTFADHRNLLPTLEKAAHAPHYSVNIPTGATVSDYIPMASVRQTRAIARILVVRAKQQRAAGDPDDALATIITLFKLCRHFDKEPTIISYVVAIACRSFAIAEANAILQHSRMSDDSYEALERELARHNLSEPYHHALVTERALGLAMIEDYAAHTGGWFTQAFWLFHKRDYLDYVSREIEIAKLPVEEMQGARESTDEKGLATFTGLLRPAVSSLYEATVRTTAGLRTLRILNAIKRQAPDVTKIDPGQLDLPQDVLRDPFNGQPMTIRSTDDGWLIYSVGSDLQDDGGKLDDFTDIGIGPDFPN